MRILFHIVRGLTYSFTSMVALLTGYLMQNSLNLLKTQTATPIPFDINIINFYHQFQADWPKLVIPLFASIFFFMCYIERFPAELPEKEDSIVESSGLQSIIVYSLIVGGGVICFIIFRYIVTATFTVPLIVALATQAAFYICYGVFLRASKGSKYSPVIQHQLVWSVILSIGISLYIGLIFPKLSDPNLPDPWLPLVPIMIIGVLFVLTEILKAILKEARNKKFKTWLKARLEKRNEKFNARLFEIAEKLKAQLFLIVNISAFLITVGVVILVKNAKIFVVSEDLANYLITMQFCVLVSAYLAVFEAWGVTSLIAKIENNPDVATAEPGNKKSSRYSLATLLALTVSVCALPLFFVYSDYGVLFLVLFGLHALIAFSYWAVRGQGDRLATKNWRAYKTIAGSTFLSGMVGITLAQSYFSVLSTKVEGSFISKHITWTIIGILFTLSLIVGKKFSDKVIDESNDWEKVFNERVNFTRVLTFMCVVACVFLQIIYDKSESELAYKADLAFIFYCICIGICLLVELGETYRSKPKISITMSQIFAFLVLIRTVPSLLIALAVFFPSVYTGRGVWASVLSALPFFLSAAGGYALNDYYDVEKDSITKPYRAIPSGKLSRLTVLRFSRITISLAVLAALAAFFFSQNLFELGLYISCILSVTLYNVVVKHVSLSKTFLTAIVSSIPLLFSVIAYQYPPVYLFLPLATCSFILGREWLMDVRDLKGDTGRTLTIPMQLGTRPTIILGFVFQFATVLLLLPIAINFPSYWSISLIIMIGVSSALLAKLWTYNSGMFYQRVVQLLWLPMLFGVLLFVK